MTNFISHAEEICNACIRVRYFCSSYSRSVGDLGSEFVRDAPLAVVALDDLVQRIFTGGFYRPIVFCNIED